MGLSGSGLTSQRLRKKPVIVEKPPAKNKLLVPIVAGTALVVIGLLVVIIYLLTNGSGSAGPTAGTSPRVIEGTGNTTPAQHAGSSFCGVSLSGNKIIYVLDRGSSTNEWFGYLKAAAIQSIRSLGSDKQFQIIFWDNGSEGAYPPGPPTYASTENIDLCQKEIDDIFPFGQTQIGPAIKKALSSSPSTIVLVTGKGWDLDDAFVKSVTDLVKGDTKVDTIAIGGSGGNSSLKKVAGATGGEYKEVSQTELKAFAQ